jgi:hypothetical protein
MIQLMRRDPMLKHSSICALAAVATIGGAVLAPTTSASAYKFGQGGIIKGQILHVPPAAIGVVPKPVNIGVNVPKPVHIGILVPPHPITGVIVHPEPPRMVWWSHHHSPWLIDADPTPVGTTGATVATTPTAPCTCLTKRYLEDGSVLFKDVCTKEAAMATPDELRAQAQGVGP